MTNSIQRLVSVSCTIINDKNEVLLLRTAKAKTYNAGLWNVIPGKLLAGADPKETIIQKVEDKIGLKPEIIFGPSSWSLYQPDQKVVFNDLAFLGYIAESDFKLNPDHALEFMWFDWQTELPPKDSVPFLKENLHNVFLTKQANPFKIIYTNYKGETEPQFLIPNRIYFGSTEYHPTDGWLLEALKYPSNAVRTYAIKDIHAVQPAVYLPEA